MLFFVRNEEGTEKGTEEEEAEEEQEKEEEAEEQEEGKEAEEGRERGENFHERTGNAPDSVQVPCRHQGERISVRFGRREMMRMKNGTMAESEPIPYSTLSFSDGLLWSSPSTCLPFFLRSAERGGGN